MKITEATSISSNKAIKLSPYVTRFGVQSNIEMKNWTKEISATDKKWLEHIHKNIREHKLKYAKSIVKGKALILRCIEISESVLLYRHLPINPLEESWISVFKVAGYIGTDSYEVDDENQKYKAKKVDVKRSKF